MDLEIYKKIASFIAVLLAFIAYVPYYLDILRKKTQPHVYTWGLWSLLSGLIVALQIKGGAGSAIFVTIAAGLLSFGVVILGLRNGKKVITKSDTAVALLALLAIALWLIAKQPILSAILVVVADILAFIPTIRKSWSDPYSETFSLYLINIIRFSLALFAVESYTLLSSLWLSVWVTVSIVFALMLFIRRKNIKNLVAV